MALGSSNQFVHAILMMVVINFFDHECMIEPARHAHRMVCLRNFSPFSATHALVVNLTITRCLNTS